MKASESDLSTQFEIEYQQRTKIIATQIAKEFDQKIIAIKTEEIMFDDINHVNINYSIKSKDPILLAKMNLLLTEKLCLEKRNPELGMKIIFSFSPSEI